MPPADSDDKRGKLPPIAPPPRSSPNLGGPPPPTGTAPRPAAGRPPDPAQPNAMRPIPTPEGFMSTAAKISLADMALALREEQIEAKVVEYKGELATNPELDAVTAQVIAELQSLQAAVRSQTSPPSRPDLSPEDRANLEIELIRSLKEMLARIFRPGKLATVIERKLGEVAKRFARLFFESELADKIRGAGAEHKVMRFAEQALYHALLHSEAEVLGRLDQYQYGNPKVRERARADFALRLKELRNAFLARTTPELNTLVKYLNEVLTAFFIVELPPMLGELSWEVVKEARLAEANRFGGYKISAKTFPVFRQAFERRFMQRLVPFVEDEMLKRVRESMGSFRSETIRFVADPMIFSSICEVFSDSVYDMLYNDGFLDLPSDWRARLTLEG
jgi:hypothetical protein